MNKVLSRDEFIKEWIKAHDNNMSMQELADHLGIPKQSVSQRRMRIEKRGLILPTLKDGRVFRYSKEKLENPVEFLMVISQWWSGAPPELREMFPPDVRVAMTKLSQKY